MADIQNIKRLQRKLEKLADRYRGGGTPSVVVGYTANYAVYVHERQARHAPGKQWKFLEQPARELGKELGDLIARALQGGAKLLQALYTAGVRLQRESQQIVPVDTGNLRGSAFTAREDELELVMATGEAVLAIRQAKQKKARQKLSAKRWNKIAEQGWKKAIKKFTSRGKR